MKKHCCSSRFFWQAVRDHSACFFVYLLCPNTRFELTQCRGSCWRSLNVTVKEREWRSIAVCHCIWVRGGSWPGWMFFRCFLIYSLLSLVHKYDYVSNHAKQFPCLFFIFFARLSLFRQWIHLCYLWVSWTGREQVGRHRFLLNGHMVLLACG